MKGGDNMPSILDILKHYGYPESVYQTASQDFLNALIKKYYKELSESSK
jgi:hypothetical protein